MLTEGAQSGLTGLMLTEGAQSGLTGLMLTEGAQPGLTGLMLTECGRRLYVYLDFIIFFSGRRQAYPSIILVLLLRIVEYMFV